VKRTNVDNRWLFGGAFHAPYFASWSLVLQRRIRFARRLAVDGNTSGTKRDAPATHRLMVVVIIY
jgi:hypothetical protein